VSDALSIISKLGSAEKALLSGTFVAPVCGNDTVAATVHGMVYKFSVARKPEPGWYRFRPSDPKCAQVDGPADLSDIENYLRRFPSVRVVLMARVQGVYQGIAVQDKTHEMTHELSVPVFLVDDFADDFDKVVCRFDGCNLWYERTDPANDPAKGQYLRDQFDKLADPKTIQFKGLTFQEKAAYSIRFVIDTKAREERKVQSLRTDIEHAGGVFLGLKEKNDNFEVSYQVDGETYMSVVSKDAAHSVLSAGICLSGYDRDFDLKSLVTVMREGQRQRRIVRGHGNFGHVRDEDDDY